MKNLKEAFGHRLREIRKGKNYTQETLAEMIDLSPRQLIRIENGENFPSAETLGKLSLFLNIELESLFRFKCNEDAMYLATGIYNKPVLKVLKNGEMAIIKSCSQSSIDEFKIPSPIKFKDSADYILKISRKTNKPIVVEYFENKERISIKMFYPNGKIEEILSKNDILNCNQYNYIVSKLKKISSNSNKLEFVKLSIDSFENRDALEKLKILIQGMELTL